MQIADAAHLNFGCKVTLLNMKEKKYLFTPFHDGPISATGCHPTLLNSIAEGTTEFTVLNAQNKEYSGLITFGSALSLCTDQ